jgi:hypothetical protein
MEWQATEQVAPADLVLATRAPTSGGEGRASPATERTVSASSPLDSADRGVRLRCMGRRSSRASARAMHSAALFRSATRR